MARNFDEILSKDRSFTVKGETFHYVDLSPEQLFSEVDIKENGDDGLLVWKLTDAQIMRYLPEEEHERWKALRARETDPATIKQLNAIVEWLWEEATGRPLTRPEPSEAGPGKTARSSTAGSR